MVGGGFNLNRLNLLKNSYRGLLNTLIIESYNNSIVQSMAMVDASMLTQLAGSVKLHHSIHVIRQSSNNYQMKAKRDRQLKACIVIEAEHDKLY